MVSLQKLRQLSFEFGIACLIAFAIFGALEGICRLWVGGTADPMRTYDNALREGLKPKIFEQKQIGHVESYYSDLFPTRYYSKIDDAREKAIRVNKSERGFRIFFYGASTVAGSPYGNWASFAHLVAEGLRTIQKPGVDVEVMNFGASGLNSSHILDLVNSTLSYDPDFLVIYAGHNDFCDQVNSYQGGSKVHAFLMTHLYLMRVLHERLVRLRVQPGELFLERPCPQTLSSSEDKTQSEQRMMKNMRSIVDLAALKHVGLVFVSQVGNVMVPPLASTPAEKELLRLAQGLPRDKALGPQVEVGVATLIKEDSQNAVAHFVRGLVEMSDPESLQAHHGDLVREFDLAVQNDHHSSRATPSMNQALSLLQDPPKGVYFVDAVAHARHYVSDGVLDGRLLMDVIHPNVTGYRVIAEAILDGFFRKHKIREDLFEYSRYEPEWLWRRSVRPEWYAAVCDRYYRKRELSLADCARIFADDYLAAKSEDERRRKSVAWEPLFWSGFLDRREDALLKSAEIFKAPYRTPFDSEGP